MDFKDEIETSLSSLARKIQYILAVQLFAKRWKTARENMRAAEETVSWLIFLQREDLSTTFTDSSFESLLASRRVFVKYTKCGKKNCSKKNIEIKTTH